MDRAGERKLSLTAWLAALRALPQNPLLAQANPLDRALRQALAEPPASKASLALRLLLAFITLAYLMLYAQRLYKGSAPLPPHFNLYVLLGLSAIVVFFMLPGFCRRALGLLADTGRRGSVQGIDYALLHSPLTDHELLLGSLLRLLRGLVIPLLACTLLMSFTRESAYVLYSGQQVDYFASGQFAAAILRVFGDFLWRGASAVLALACFGLLLISLNAGRQKSWLLPLCTVMAVIWQIMLLAISSMFLYVSDFCRSDSFFGDGMYNLPAYSGIVFSVVLSAVAVFLARRLLWLRPMLAGLLPLAAYGLLVALNAAQYISLLVSHLGEYLKYEFVWGLTAYSLINPQALRDINNLGHPFYSAWRIGLLFILQLALIFTLAELARDGISRLRQED